MLPEKVPQLKTRARLCLRISQSLVTEVLNLSFIAYW